MRINHNESRTQQACVRWFRYMFPEHAQMLIAVPNGVATSASQGAILKAEGMLAGVADLLLLLPTSEYTMLAIEMKTPKGVQSEHQRIWQREAEKHGIRYEVVRSFDQFQELTTKHVHDYENKRNH